MPTKKKTKISKSKKKSNSKKKVKRTTTKRTTTKRTKTKRTKTKGTKRTKGTKGTKTKGTKTKGTKKIYKTQIQLESDDKELIEKCKKFSGKSKDCRSARRPDGRPECWYNYDTELCTAFVPKK